MSRRLRVMLATNGRFFFRPIKGDCVHAPLTRFEGGRIATWNSERRP